MKTIGLVGGVASGKSVVAQLFVDLGAGRLDADAAGHEILNHDAVVRKELLRRWGEEILNSDASIDRSAVARRVFGVSDETAVDRAFLEALLHPRIRQQLEAKAATFASNGRPAVILDAPLLLEANWRPLCDLVVFVDADRDIRLARAFSRGWTADEFARREAAQLPIEKKRAAAAITLSNNGSVDELRSAVRAIWDQLVAP